MGEFPLKIYPGYIDGYGYGNGLFYGDIFLYFPALLCYLGLNVLIAYKIFILVCTIFTAYLMFVCVKGISKSNYAGMVSAIIYTLSSYRMLDLYERAAIGEILAFMLLPIIVLGVYQLIYEDYKQWYILALGFSGLILSHIISAVLMAGFIALLIIFNVKRLFKEPKRILFFLLASLTSFLLCAFFILPLLEQLHNNEFLLTTKTITDEIWNTTVPVYKIFFEIPNMVFRLGGPSGIGIIFLGIILFRFKVKGLKESFLKFSDLLLIMGILALIVTTKLFPWESIVHVVNQLAAIQFSWRFYLFATLFLSISGSIMLYKYCTKVKMKIIGMIIILALSILACSMNMFASYAAYGYYAYKGLYNLDLNHYSIGFGEYLPANTNLEKLYKRGEKVTSNNENINLQYDKNGTNIVVHFSDNNKKSYIEVPLIYYLGYTAIYSNGTVHDKLHVESGKNNILRVDLENYKSGTISIKYSGSALQNTSEIVSLITVLMLLVFLMVKTGIKIVQNCNYSEVNNKAASSAI